MLCFILQTFHVSQTQRNDDVDLNDEEVIRPPQKRCACNSNSDIKCCIGRMGKRSFVPEIRRYTSSERNLSMIKQELNADVILRELLRQKLMKIKTQREQQTQEDFRSHASPGNWEEKRTFGEVSKKSVIRRRFVDLIKKLIRDLDKL